jgi:predicted metal-dependent hydrolase
MNLFRVRLRSDDLVDVRGRPVRLRVNPRARRISLRVDAQRGEVVATAPTAGGLADALRFAESRGDWIADRLAALPTQTPLRPGLTIEVAGQPCLLERAAMRIAPRLVPATGGEPQRLLAYGDDERYGRAIVRALKAEALCRLTARTELHAQRLGQPMPTIAVADPKGRWGSCRQAGRGRPAAIRYSWRLVLTPPSVLDYVAAHETAHLIEGNHGPRFWSVVDELYGDHTQARRWLRRHGGRLHGLTA